VSGGETGTPESWLCVDCGRDTAPGWLGMAEATKLTPGKLDRIVMAANDGLEVYTVKDAIWTRAGAPDGCLCIGCLEQRLGRRLKPKDFHHDDPYARLPGTPRLLKRRKLAKAKGKLMSRVYGPARGRSA
jgi:hypothetical protein